MNEEYLNLTWNRCRLYPALFLLALLIRLASFTGLVGSDDLGYSYFAQLVSHGAYTLIDSSHLGQRLGVTIPTGLIYGLFGISEFTTVLISLIASSATVVLLVEIGTRLFSKQAALIAGALLLTFPVHVHYASILVPEPIMEFWILAGVLLYLIALKNQQLTMCLIAGFCFGLAYLSKEAGIFVCASLFLYSVSQKQWKLAIAVASGLTVVGVLELAGYYYFTGDLMYRHHVIATTQEAYLKINGGETNSLYWRLFKEYPYAMLFPNIDFGLHSIFALALSVFGMFIIPRRTLLLLFLWAIVPMSYINFGTISFTKYFPSFAAPRYIGQVYYPLFLIVGATMATWITKDSRKTYALLGVFALTVSVGFACALASRAQGYHTSMISSLRAIESKISIKQQSIVSFEGPDAKRWLSAMSILSGQRQNSVHCEKDCLVVRPDFLGLPYTINEPFAQTNENNKSTLIFPF